ncbi:hypothetical protein GCM10020221_36320 [Streptomyces thioluteus]|uniref:DegT/DnrJ/EryC1/StrS aminotransferase family protein n=1 Tax=Streptomyces thioluteus TaxID=66431 RepID=A0ABN3X5G6_STRTU
MQAEILRRKLGRLDSYIEGRRAVARRYEEGLGDLTGPGGLVLPSVNEGNDHVHYVYVVRHPRRDAVLEALEARGISLNISYPWPVHTMSGFAHLGWSEGSLPVTERPGRRDLLAAHVPLAPRGGAGADHRGPPRGPRRALRRALRRAPPTGRK